MCLCNIRAMFVCFISLRIICFFGPPAIAPAAVWIFHIVVLERTNSCAATVHNWKVFIKIKRLVLQNDALVLGYAHQRMDNVRNITKWKYHVQLRFQGLGSFGTLKTKMQSHLFSTRP